MWVFHRKLRVPLLRAELVDHAHEPGLQTALQKQRASPDRRFAWVRLGGGQCINLRNLLASPNLPYSTPSETDWGLFGLLCRL